MSSSDSAVDKEEGFISHLIELRDRLVKMLLAVGILFLSLFWFSDKIYTALAAPLLKHLPDSQMIAIDVAAPFFIPFKLTLMLCVFLAVPYLLYQIWSFVAPGLYAHEKKLVVPLLVSSTLLFYLGVAFAYFVVFPLVFGFFTSVAPEGVTVSTDIGRYLDFVITLFFAFGIAFEVPVATVLVVAVGITTPEQLVKIRPYVFVAAFIIGMFLTPPDMISQTLLAIPMWLLYEVGIIFSRKYKDRIAAAGLARDKRYDDEGDGEPDPEEPGPGAPGSSSGAKGAPRNEKHEPEYTPPKPSAKSGTDTGKADTDGQSASSAKLGVVNPSLIKKPDASGAYRNSLTDSDSEDPPQKPDSKTDES
ncbi:MAG: twin-arginine translocase subunit TatC [Granulosicoccus sp.]